MAQVIQLHPFKQSYPFGLQKQSQSTYVQLFKQLSSQTQFQTYRQNLVLFKSIQSDLVISLDSYIKQGNTLQLYYEYEPLSIKTYIEAKVVIMAEEDQLRDKFLTRVITSINISIEDVIALLVGKKIMALLSIENMAIGKQARIKFFIQPDFQYVQKPAQNQLFQYYNTEKKKLQIQLEEFLEHIFSYTNSKPKDHGKANFVIQGTKLVFVNEQQSNQQSIMSGVNAIPATVNNSNNNNNNNINSNNINTNSNNINSNSNNINSNSNNINTNSNNINTNSNNTSSSTQVHQKHQIKLPAYMLKQPKQIKQAKQSQESQHNINNSQKQKFDIKKILDQKKLQKNQSQFTHAINKQHNSRSHLQQLNQDRNNNKNSFTQTNDETSDKNDKDVRNYFENNDDFNRDTSFYTEEFIQEDSIKDFDGYEDQLEKQLEDLKKKKEEEEAEQIADTSKYRLSMIPNTSINPQLSEQKMNKSPTSQQISPTTKLTQLSSTYLNQFPQNVLNSSDSRENDTSQEQQKQKKKYKVTITTSHLVDVNDDNDADLKTIEQELYEDIRNGTMNHNNEGDNNGSGNNVVKQQQNVQQNTEGMKGNSEKQGKFSPSLPIHLLKGYTKDIHNTNSSSQTYNSHQGATSTQQKSSSSNSLSSNSMQQHVAQDRPFSKQHPHVSSQTGQYTYPQTGSAHQYNSGAFTHGGNTTTSNQQAPYIKKIIQKIKNNSQNHQFINNISTNNNTNVGNIQLSTGVKNAQYNEQLQQQQNRAQQQEDTRPHSQLSSQGNVTSNTTPQNTQKKEQQKEYYDKIQKAKMKAEQLKKLVKERKGQ